ncbi:hypothetical protein K7432_015068 [Basidiobolus ranarum]|uniref:Cation efflux protein transmembrane domain-containing protein n=1 Tax=Basidiobolus ranarum TaxID=34480 RepID=A0ABR2VPE8_9FUNG
MSSNTGSHWSRVGYSTNSEEPQEGFSTHNFQPNQHVHSQSHSHAHSHPHAQTAESFGIASHTYSQPHIQGNYQIPVNNNEFPHLRQHARERCSHEQEHHDHSHDHQHHNHSHDHGHGHGHGHGHSDLPKISVSKIMSSLDHEQKRVMTYGLTMFTIGIIVWVYGHATETLSIIAFSYFLLFDSFNLLMNFTSLVLTNHETFSHFKSSQYPYGLFRMVTLLGLSNRIFLIFSGMYSIKEGFEHVLLGDEHHSIEFSVVKCLLVLAAIAMATFTKLNHIGSGRSSVSRLLQEPFNMIAFLSGLAILLVDMLPFDAIQATFLDQIITICESIGMFYISFPEAVKFSKILLQTTPKEKLSSIEQRVMEINALPHVLECRNIHFWSPTKDTLIGSMEVYTEFHANEQQVLEQVHRITAGLVNELTVQVSKRTDTR